MIQEILETLGFCCIWIGLSSLVSRYFQQQWLMHELQCKSICADTSLRIIHIFWWRIPLMSIEDWFREAWLLDPRIDLFLDANIVLLWILWRKLIHSADGLMKSFFRIARILFSEDEHCIDLKVSIEMERNDNIEVYDPFPRGLLWQQDLRLISGRWRVQPTDQSPRFVDKLAWMKHFCLFVH